MQQVAALIDTHDFWDTQPVPKSSDLITDTDFDKPIEGPRKPEDERQEPLALPANFYWADVDLADDGQAKEVYELLVANYVEDSDNTLRFDYSIDFLRWALTPPGFKKNWLLGVRGGKKNKLFGFISGVPV